MTYAYSNYFVYIRSYTNILIYYIHAHMLHSTDAQGTTIQIKYTPSHKCTGF